MLSHVLKTILSTAALFFTASIARADAVTDLAASLHRLSARSSYAWETTISPTEVSVWDSPWEQADPDAPRGIRRSTMKVPAPIQGVTEHGVATVISASLDRSDEWKTEGRLRAILVDQKHGVVETTVDWQTAAEVAGALSAAALARDKTLREEYALRTGRLLLSLSTPTDELASLLADAQPAMRFENALVATLSDATARSFVFALRYRNGANAIEAMPDYAEGRVKIWLRNGDLIQYEVVVNTTALAARDQQTRKAETNLRITKLTTLSNFDRASVKIPRKAEAKLNALEPFRD